MPGVDVSAGGILSGSPFTEEGIGHPYGRRLTEEQGKSREDDATFL